MEPIDTFLKKINKDLDFKIPVNALISFFNPDTGKLLCKLVANLIRSETSQSTLTVLHFIDENMATEIGDLEYYKNTFYDDIVELYEAKQLLIRIFVKISADYVDDILEMGEKYPCNLLLIGVEHETFPGFWEENYPRLKNSVANIPTTAIFVNNGFQRLNRIFVPILDKTDVYVFLFINRLIVQEKVSVMIWDAIGIIESEPKMKKLYQYFYKKAEGKLELWNNEKKIGIDYIAEQDLVLMGIEGWEKLQSSAVSWAHSLPSALIVKPATNEGK
ncbi:MAG: hypothetical protein WAP46_05930 [Dysgonamonadaceae bacterium]|jgi:hypothetical protein|nr:hypothetical protein [Dysgonamonadaceae bacterium]